MDYEKIIMKQSQFSNCQYEMKMLLDKKSNSLEINGSLIKEKNIYLFTYPKIMEIYDCITFKIISKFELPIKPDKYEIIDNNYILIYEKHKLYCYSINLSENKLIFIFGVNDVYLSKYLKEKKEILIKLHKAKGFSRINLKGQIMFYEEEKPEIYFQIDESLKNKNKENKASKNEDDLDFEYIEDTYLQDNSDNYINSFNKDKYIIQFFGYYLSSADPYDDYSEEEFNISVYETESMKEIFSSDNLSYNYYKKLNDMLFVSEDGYKPVFFYDDNKKEIKVLDLNDEGKFFSLGQENKIALFTEPNIIHLIDFSTGIKKSIKLNEKYNNDNIINIGYYSENENEYLYLVISQNYKRCMIKVRIL